MVIDASLSAERKREKISFSKFRNVWLEFRVFCSMIFFCFSLKNVHVIFTYDSRWILKLDIHNVAVCTLK